MRDDQTLSSRAGRWTRRGMLSAGVAAVAFVAAGPAAFAATVAGGVTERDVSVTTPDGKADAVLFHPAKGRGPWPAILLWPDFGGLRPAIRAWGRELAAAGYVVLMPNAFYRSAPPSSDDINMADPETRKRMTQYRAEATDDGIARDAVAYLAFLDAQPQTDKRRKAGTLGYDLGGSYAFRTAAAAPDRVGAVVCLYGLGVATARPNSPHLLVPTSKAAYYVAVAKDDDAREPGDKDDIKAVLAEGKLQGTVEVYSANHGWATPGSPAADAAATERAQRALLELLKKL